jgi:hypothetical protein
MITEFDGLGIVPGLTAWVLLPITSETAFFRKKLIPRIPTTSGVEVHHDLGVDINYRAYVTGNPVAASPPVPMWVAPRPYAPGAEISGCGATARGPRTNGCFRTTCVRN